MKIEIKQNEADQRLDKFLRKLMKDVPLGMIFKSIRNGNVKVNGKKSKQNYRLELGDILTIKYVQFDSESNIKKFNRVDFSAIQIAYEDENILVIEKWPGVLVHADEKDGEASLTDYVLSYLFNKGDYDPKDELTFRPAPCNRLDRNTSGMVVYGKNMKALQVINEMIRNRSIKKYYCALVKGRIESGLYEGYIVKDINTNTSKVFKKEVEGSKKIAMDVELIDSVGSYSYVEIELITGRSHQLRAHLASLGNYIIGDKKYGDKKINNYFNNKYTLGFQYLYAYKLIFKDCPEEFSYLENKVITQALPPILKRVKKDVLKF